MRISDWSSDVCSSDLQTLTGDDTNVRFASGQRLKLRLAEANPVSGGLRFELPDMPVVSSNRRAHRERKSVVEGKRVSDRVDIGGRRITKKKKKIQYI